MPRFSGTVCWEDVAASGRRSGRNPRPYPPEFRQRALDLVRLGRSVVEVAKLLGIAESCLYRWEKQDLIDRGLKPAPESAELAAARRKIRDLEEENKILRKAAAAVEQVVPPKTAIASWPSSTLTGSESARPCYALGVSTSGFHNWKRGPVGQVDSARVADRPDRAGPRRLLWHLRPAKGPRRAAAHARPGGRP
jgi:transposase-like protein